jgi:uncharacterized OsmC-like protein
LPFLVDNPSLVFHAAANGIKIRRVESRLEGEIDLRGFLGLSSDVRIGYENIWVYFRIDADISEREKEELIKVAQKHSPVFDNIFNATRVSVQLEE